MAHPETQNNGLQMLAQLLQMTHTQQAPQNEDATRMHEMIQLMGLHQTQQSHAAEQAFKQQQLEQGNTQFNQTLGLHNQQEAGNLLHSLIQTGQGQSPEAAALWDKIDPALRPAMEKIHYGKLAEQQSVPIAQMYAAHALKPDLKALQAGLTGYLPNVHPKALALIPKEQWDQWNSSMPEAQGVSIAGPLHPDVAAAMEQLTQRKSADTAQQQIVNQRFDDEKRRQLIEAIKGEAQPNWWQRFSAATGNANPVP